MNQSTLSSTLSPQILMEETSKEDDSDSMHSSYSQASLLWRKTFQILKAQRFIFDPWHNFNQDQSQVFTATRYRYSAIKKKWIEDSITVKIEDKSFDRGAMRECFRLKKLTSSGDWRSASNYVAKRYIDKVCRETYFDDVRLQMEAKLWGEAFNRCDPPKKVDIFQLSIIEVEQDSTKQIYHIERFMEGEYRKYNSNSGFVDEKLRNTPHTFSHFTFERSGHRLIIVDIQGVGDLYTDPQIHTADGIGYSEANLGLRGMALFFHSHRCNPICEHLCLAPFDLSNTEFLSDHPTNPVPNILQDNDPIDYEPVSREPVVYFKLPVDDKTSSFDLFDNFERQHQPGKIENKSMNRRRTVSCNTSRDSVLASYNSQPSSINSSRIFGSTVVRRSEESLLRPVSGIISPSLVQAHSMEFSITRDRAASGDSGIQGIDSLHRSCSLVEGQEFNWSTQLNQQDTSIFTFSNLSINDVPEFNNSKQVSSFRRNRSVSESSDVDCELIHESNNLGSPSLSQNHFTFHHYHHHLMHDTQKPASADHPTNLDQEIGQSILGQIHHELARLHEAGRFIKGREQLAWSTHRKKSKSPKKHSLSHVDQNSDLELEYSSGPLEEITSNQVDWDSVIFHEKHAAQLGCLEAMIVMAHYYLGLPSTLLYNCPIASEMSDLSLGIDYLWRAAEGGDRRCMILLARYLDTYAEGPPDNSNNVHVEWTRFITTPAHLIVLPKLAQAILEKQNIQKSEIDNYDLPAITGKPWSEACVWYRKAIEAALTKSTSKNSLDNSDNIENFTTDNEGLDAEGRYDAADDLLPVHRLLARIAELHIIGGHGIMRNPSKAGDLFNEAGEAATVIHQGQLAMRYFELAEEAWALVTQEDDL